MLLEILRFELKYRFSRPDTYLYFFVLFAYSLIAVDFIYDTDLGQIKRNSPFIIGQTMSVVTSFFMVVVSMIMGLTALRDFDHQMAPFLFITDLKKRDYLAGRFLGAFLMVLFVFLGLLLGIMLGNFMPWKSPENMQPFRLGVYLQPFFYRVLPSLFFSSALFFVIAALTKKLLVVYTQGIVFLMVFIISLQLSVNQDLTLSALLDPFTFQAGKITVQFWSIIEKNQQLVPLQGVLLFNRILWCFLGVIALVIGYWYFDFTLVKSKKHKVVSNKETDLKSTTTSIVHFSSFHVFDTSESFQTKVVQFVYHVGFYFRGILKEPVFWALVVLTMGILLVNSISLGDSHGVDSLPMTSIVIGELLEMSLAFFFLVAIFITSELVWKERNANIDALYDTMPVSSFMYLSAKLISLLLIYVCLIVAMIVSGVLFQVSRGYYQFEWQVYVSDLFIGFFPFLILFTLVSFAFQSVTNHKVIGHILSITFIMGAAFIPKQMLGIDHGLINFGAGVLEQFSAMNAYGSFLQPFLWFKAYWLGIALLLFVFAVLLSIRGKEVSLWKRTKQGQIRITTGIKMMGAVAIFITLTSGMVIAYNTLYLNEYDTLEAQNAFRADYEKSLKQFEDLPQPEVSYVKLNIELFPTEETYTIDGYFWLKNNTEKILSEVHVQKYPHNQIALAPLWCGEGTVEKHDFAVFEYRILELGKPLQPGDSIRLEFEQTFISEGFIEHPQTKVIENGTFFHNLHLPTLGYNNYIELIEPDLRKQFTLPPKARRAAIDDPVALRTARMRGDGEEIEFDITLGTESDQTAVAPGNLMHEWEKDGRKYFQYQSSEPMSNMYAIGSGRYDVFRDQWQSSNPNSKPVQLEIYHHPEHTYNLDRMMNAMKVSLTYFSKNFSPYPYEVLRIQEIPHYDKKAQSFPTMVPFSESLGFVMDIDDEQEVDMAFFITAHEVSHQWWGHIINPADVQGKSMVAESLAQYSALMALKEAYGAEKVKQLVQQQTEQYLRERSREKQYETSLALVESGQQYIHYQKGLVNLYALQYHISEEKVNLALSRFIRDWNSTDGLKKEDTYPTSKELMGYFREVTPDSLQYLITDLFEDIILHELEITEASTRAIENGKFSLEAHLKTTKFRIDSLCAESEIPINDWIEIGIYGENEKLILLEKVRITQRNILFKKVFSEKPSSIIIDPNKLMMEREEENNAFDLRS